MKGFGDFFAEARTSQASEKAKKLGLKGTVMEAGTIDQENL